MHEVTFELLDGGRGSVLRRRFTAAPEFVFPWWTEAELLRQWWGPHAITVSECFFDNRPGGRYKIVMTLEGVNYPMEGEIRRCEDPRNVSYSVELENHPADWRAHFRPEGSPHAHVPLTWEYDITFMPDDEGTLVTVRATYPIADDGDVMLRMGSEQGWSESFEKLDAILAA
jgi:uncharacterized protein YndB with AHSA1/START domain